MVEGGLIPFFFVGLYANPGDGEAEDFTSQFGGAVDVLGVSIPEVDCSFAGGEVLAAFPKIPDILSFWIVGFDLMVRIGHSKEEFFWKLHVL